MDNTFKFYGRKVVVDKNDVTRCAQVIERIIKDELRLKEIELRMKADLLIDKIASYLKGEAQ